MRFFDLLRASRGATHTLTDRPVAHKACTWRVGDGVAGLAGRPCHRRLFLRRGQKGPSKSVIAAGAAKCWTVRLAGMLMMFTCGAAEGAGGYWTVPTGGKRF